MQISGSGCFLSGKIYSLVRIILIVCAKNTLHKPDKQGIQSRMRIFERTGTPSASWSKPSLGFKSDVTPQVTRLRCLHNRRKTTVCLVAVTILTMVANTVDHDIFIPNRAYGFNGIRQLHLVK